MEPHNLALPLLLAILTVLDNYDNMRYDWVGANPGFGHFVHRLSAGVDASKDDGQ